MFDSTQRQSTQPTQPARKKCETRPSASACTHPTERWAAPDPRLNPFKLRADKWAYTRTPCARLLRPPSGSKQPSGMFFLFFRVLDSSFSRLFLFAPRYGGYASAATQRMEYNASRPTPARPVPDIDLSNSQGLPATTPYPFTTGPAVTFAHGHIACRGRREEERTRGNFERTPGPRAAAS